MRRILQLPHYCPDSFQGREGTQVELDSHSELRRLSWRSKEVKSPGTHGGGGGRERERARAMQRETSSHAKRDLWKLQIIFLDQLSTDQHMHVKK